MAIQLKAILYLGVCVEVSFNNTKVFFISEKTP